MILPWFRWKMDKGRGVFLQVFQPTFARVLYIGELGADSTILKVALWFPFWNHFLFVAPQVSTLWGWEMGSNIPEHSLIKFLQNFTSVLNSGTVQLPSKVPRERMEAGQSGGVERSTSLCSDSMLSFKFMPSIFALRGKPRWRLWEQTCHGTSFSYFVTLRMPFLPPRRSVIACICHLLTSPCELKFSPKRFM